MQGKLSRLGYVLLGIFCLLALVLATTGLFVIADQEGWTGNTIPLESSMRSAQGIRSGTRVRVLGIPVGQVTAVIPPKSPAEPVIVKFWIAKDHRELVRSDATIRVVKDGLVGERFLEIDPGTPQADPVSEGARLASIVLPDWDTLLGQIDRLVLDLRAGEGTLGQLLTDDEALRSFRELVESARIVLHKIDFVVEDVQSGKGTAGRLLVEDDAYRSLQKLLGHAEEVLSAVDENYASAKQNWLLKSWLKDRYQLLVRPDVKKYRKVFREHSLFEEGRAILTKEGKISLNEVAKWIGGFDDREAEILVAGFAVDEPDGRMAELTTRKQAEAVLGYLVDQHSIHKTGWFSRRAVIAHGFGNLPDPDGSPDLPPRRIEILAFVK